jgi:hypothetical protein
VSVERDVDSVLRESEALFGGHGAVHRTLRTLASRLAAEHRRLVDLADVQRTIEALKLPKELGEKLHPSVRAEYGRLWALAQRAGEGPVER